MKDLAKEYAALVPEWAEGKPGVACCDPESGDRFRLTDADGWIAEHRFNDLGQLTAGYEHLRQDWLDAHARAIAAGPDLDDAATVGALLLGLGESVQLCRRTSWNADGTDHPYVWAGPVDSFGNGEIGADVAEAIIRACIAQARGGGK